MRLRELREDRDIKQETIAAYLHVKQSTYSQYETGKRQIPISLLVALAYYYDTSVDYILEITAVRQAYPRIAVTHTLQ